MNTETFFRWVFLCLTLGIFGVRGYFGQLAKRQGNAAYALDDQAVQREGRWSIVFRMVAFFYMISSLILYAINPTWLKVLALFLPPWLRWIGILLGIGGLVLMAWTHQTLGKMFSTNLRIREGHALVTTGPYARIRNPMYTAMIGYGIGWALVTSNWLFMIMAVAILVGSLVRTPKEEAMLIEKFGDEYREYMKKAGRYWPKWKR